MPNVAFGNPSAVSGRPIPLPRGVGELSGRERSTFRKREMGHLYHQIPAALMPVLARDSKFESIPLQRRVCLCSAFHACRRKARLTLSQPARMMTRGHRGAFEGPMVLAERGARRRRGGAIGLMHSFSRADVEKRARCRIVIADVIDGRPRLRHGSFCPAAQRGPESRPTRYRGLGRWDGNRTIWPATRALSSKIVLRSTRNAYGHDRRRSQIMAV